MNPFQFLKQVQQMPAAGGDGFRTQVALNPMSDLRTAAGLVLTAATTPAVVAIETNGLIVQAAASSNVLGTLTFRVPNDYDETADELKVVVLANSAGDTNTPVLSATAYRKRAGAALSADLAPTSSTAIPTNTAKAAERTITISGKGLLGGDLLVVNLTSGAHTTDAVNIYGVAVQYKTGVVLQTLANR